MGIVLNRNDFKGLFEITFPNLNGRDLLIEGQLDLIERIELIRLFGNDLFADYIANPTDIIYDPIKQPIVEGSLISISLKDTILPFVYFQYQRANYAFATENGRVKKESSTATVFNPYSFDVSQFNKAVDGWKALQGYLRTNFDNFEGIDKSYIFL